MASPVFCARIIWHADVLSPAWELQTEHPGFLNWMAPALFANGYTSPHPRRLDLLRGHLVLTLDTAASLRLLGAGSVLYDPAEVAGEGARDPRSSPGLGGILLNAWRVHDEGGRFVIASCDRYASVHAVSPAELSRLGLDGIWRPVGYEVVGPGGHYPVTIETDESGRVVGARLESSDGLPASGVNTAAITIMKDG